MDKLIQKIQASRNFADPVLYGGALQDNTDLYYKANKLASQSDVPEGPPKLFTNYGATVEIDNRPFMSIGLQVPRNPEQEALNEYFNRKRIADFAVAQSRMNVSEQLAKQAELMANNVIRDEIDRRAGIRRTVLEATGYTPAQIEQEMAANALGGINQNAIDIRDRQVQDAVNLYYNIHNIPLPVTTPASVQTAIAATVPTSVATELPADDAEAAVATDLSMVESSPEFVFGGAGQRGEEEAAPAYSSGIDLSGEENDGATGGAGNWAGPLPEEVRGVGLAGAGAVDPNIADQASFYTIPDCINYIKKYNILIPATRNSRMPTKLLADGTLAKLKLPALRSIVAEHMNRQSRRSLANNQGIGAGK